MRFAMPLICSKCQQPIVRGEGFGFIYLNSPGKEGYRFFHCRIGGGDCWEAYLRGGKPESKAAPAGEARCSVTESNADHAEDNFRTCFRTA